jgi:hypothetical protein
LSNPTHQSQPPQAEVDQIIGLYNQGQLEQTVSLAESLANQYPNALILYDILGAAYMGLNDTDKTIHSSHTPHLEGFHGSICSGDNPKNRLRLRNDDYRVCNIWSKHCEMRAVSEKNIKKEALTLRYLQMFGQVKVVTTTARQLLGDCAYNVLRTMG